MTAMPRPAPLFTGKARETPSCSSNTAGRRPLQSLQPSNLPLPTEHKPANIVDPSCVLKWEDFLYVMLKWNAKWFEERGKKIMRFLLKSFD